MTREETVVLTTLYNMLSGHFKTNKKAILTCFDPSKHKEVINALLMLRSKSIIYINEKPFDYNHYINWDIFKEEMIDQELINKTIMKNKPHKHAEKIKAWADGAEVERYSHRSNCWVLDNKPTWGEDALYRIKTQPKLVPFDTEDEFGNLIGRVVISKETGSTYLITGVSKHNGSVCTDGFWIKPEYLLKFYTFLGGTPCGKYVEE